MSEVWRQSWAIARSGWRALYNRTWRFSPRKTLLIDMGSEFFVVFLITRRAGAIAAGAGAVDLTGLLLLITLQMGWFGLMYGFARGQFQLYTGILVPLFQITPARPMAFLVGRVLESLPRRAWSTLLWAWAYSAAIAGAARWPALLLFWTVALGFSALAHLSGLLALTLWSRLSPRTLRVGLFIIFASTLGGITWAVIYLGTGGGLVDLAQRFRAARWWLGGALALVGGLPGLALLLAFVFRPSAVENLYRRGLYRVLELNERQDSRPGRSRWLPLPDGPLRAVLSRDLLVLTRSGFTLFRLATWVAGAVGAYMAGAALAGQPTTRLTLWLGGLALFAWGLPFRNLVTGAFHGEKASMDLYRLTGTPLGPVLLGKYIAQAVPAALLAGLAAAVAAGRAELGAGPALTLVLWVWLALAAGIAGGLGYAAVSAREPDPDEEAGAAAPPDAGVPGVGGGTLAASLLRTLSFAGPMAVTIWIAGGRPGLPLAIPALWPLLLVLLAAAGSLAVGWRLLGREWDGRGWSAHSPVAAHPKGR